VGLLFDNVSFRYSYVTSISVPKGAGKRIFLFTDNDNPEPGDGMKAQATQKIVEVSHVRNEHECYLNSWLGFVRLGYHHSALFHGFARPTV
jgi:hypothetical protein